MQTFEDQFDVPSGKMKVRLVHLSPDAPAVDVGVKNGNNLFNNVPFRKSTDYLTINPTNVDLEVKKAGTNDAVLSLPNVNLLPNTSYSVYAIGLANGQPSLEAIILVP